MRLNTLFVAGAAALAIIGLAAPAAAATANTNVNVRATPGGAIVDVLRRGESATIVRQSGGWCAVNKSGPDGWVACRYLDEDDDIVLPDDDDDDRRSSSPDVNLTFSIPGFSFSIGDGGADFDRPRRPRPGTRDRVCFYEHVNYNGNRFCMEPGERSRSLGSWNDRISSIRVYGDAEAQVCENNNYRGRCVVVDRDIRNLGRRGNDIISSIRVR